MKQRHTQDTHETDAHKTQIDTHETHKTQRHA